MTSSRLLGPLVVCLLLAPMAGYSAPPSQPAVLPPVPLQIPSRDELAALDLSLKAGNAEAVLAAVRSSVQRNIATPLSFGLGPALARQALAEALLGREEEARWHWAVARALSAEPWPTPLLADLGAVGAKVAAWPLRSLEVVPAGVAPLAPADRDFQPPRQIAGNIPALSEGTSGEPGPHWARLQLVIDADGWPHDPLASGPSERFTYEVLEAVRGWRFEPARRGGVAVPALYVAAINAPRERPLPGMLGGLSELEQLEAKLRAGQTEGLARQADALWSKMLDRGLISYDAQAALLLLRALADVAEGQESTGLCLAQAAQGLYPPLFDANLDPYGAAGQLLASHRFGVARSAREPLALSPGAEERIEKPSLLRGTQKVPRYTDEARKHGSGGRVMISAIIDETGAVRDPLVIGAGISARGLDFSAVEAVCQWRFDPARRAGRPIPIFYIMTVGFDLSASRGTPPPHR